jgi:hypothetical protein
MHCLQVWTTKDKPNLSWSHPWCSAPANIVPRRLMGVQPLTPGYAHFEVYPQPAQLAWATLSLPTTRGKILLCFNQTASVFNASLTIPQGSTARVCLPPATAMQVRKTPDLAHADFFEKQSVAQTTSGQHTTKSQQRAWFPQEDDLESGGTSGTVDIPGDSAAAAPGGVLTVDGAVVSGAVVEGRMLCAPTNLTSGTHTIVRH